MDECIGKNTVNGRSTRTISKLDFSFQQYETKLVHIRKLFTQGKNMIMIFLIESRYNKYYIQHISPYTIQ